MISYTCPHCGKQLKINDKYAGQQGKCQGCGNEINVPGGFSPNLVQSTSPNTKVSRFTPLQLGCMGCIGLPVGLFVFMIMIGVATYEPLEVSQQSSPANMRTGVSDVQSVTPQYTVTGNGMFAEYNANEIAATAKYEDSIILVTGLIDDIGLDILNNAYVLLDRQNIFGVQCMFEDDEKATLANLVAGKTVTIKGKVSGKFGSILLKECKVVSGGTN